MKFLKSKRGEHWCAYCGEITYFVKNECNECNEEYNELEAKDKTKSMYCLTCSSFYFFKDEKCKKCGSDYDYSVEDPSTAFDLKGSLLMELLDKNKKEQK